MGRKYILIGGLLLLLLQLSGRCETRVSSFLCNGVSSGNGVKIKKLPELVVFEKEGRKEGISAAYGGTVKGAVVVAGGCNFPDVPASEGGKKAYYNQIYVLRNPGQEKMMWEKAGQLPEKVANGASVTLPEGIVCIGGCNQDQALKKVWLLNWNADRSAIVTKDLPDLPVAMDNLAVATDGKNIYVAGGNINGKPENRCFVLEGTQAREWKELPAYPGPVRLQPAAAMLNGKFYLMGGFQPVIGEQECRVLTDGLVYDPGTCKWSGTGEILPDGEKVARGLVGTAGGALDAETMFFQGGVNRAVFKAAVDNPLLQKKAAAQGQGEELERLKKAQRTYMKHEPSWYQFNRQLLFFRPGEGKWFSLGDNEEIARAGAVAVIYNNKLVVVNGETKPGIRSAGAYIIDLGY